jgi:hypothetical protein
MRSSPLRLAALLATASFAAACGGDGLTLPDPGEPARIDAVSGSNQAGAVGSLLAEPLVVRVLDSDDEPVADRRVAFLLGSNADGGTLQPDTVTTDADGRASSRWVLGTAEGTQQARAQVVGIDVLNVNFNATAGEGVADRIELVSGNSQTATAGSTLPDSLVVRALDAANRPVAGVSITWEALGGGSVSSAVSVTASDGRTGVRHTLGPAAGDQSATASVQGVTGSPVTFLATALVGQAGRLSIEVQPPAAAVSGLPFSRQPQIQLVDANNNPVSTGGIAVIATIASGPGGATLVGSATEATNSQGLAVFTSLGISGGSGSYRINFGGTGVEGVTSDPVGVSAGAAAALAVVQQPPTSVKPGDILSPGPQVRLEDASGNPVLRGGVAITVSLSQGAGTLSGSVTKATDASGIATFDDLAISGASGSHTLLFASAGLTSTTSEPVMVVNPTPDPTTSTIVAPEKVAAGEDAVVTVTVREAGGLPLSGIAVTLEASGEDNSIAPPLVQSGADGTAVFTFSSTRAATKTLTAKAGAINLGSVEIEVTPGAPAPETTTADVPGGRIFRVTLIRVTTRDQFENPLKVGGADVEGEVVEGPNTGTLLSTTDLGDGEYELRYTPGLFSGYDYIEIRLEGVAIAGSPFESRVRN